MNFKIAIVCLQLLTTSNGDFDLACDQANPSAQTNVTCVCRRTVGSGIKWFFNGNFKSDCFLNSGCLPLHIGYTFSINVSEFAYEMTKSAYDYNDCTQINCTDISDTNVQLMVVPSAINFDPSNRAPISEPALSHSNGNISITTGCISGYMDVTCKWYTVYNGFQEKYTYGQFVFDTYDKSACSNCNDDVNAKKTCGFYHIEASGSETKNVTFRVVLTHTPTNLKWEINSANVYTVKDDMYEHSSNWNKWWTTMPLFGKVLFIFVVVVVVVGGVGGGIAGVILCRKPDNVTINCSSKDTDKILVTWSVSGCNSCTIKFTLTYKKMIVNETIPQLDELLTKEHIYTKFREDIAFNTKTVQNLKGTQFEIKNLDMGTYYEVTVLAKNICGEAVEDSQTIHTKIVTPHITSKERSLFSDKIVLDWALGDGDIKYSVTWQPKNSHKGETKHDIVKTPYEVKHLLEETYYKIQVFAFRSGNFGKPCEKTIKTLKATWKNQLLKTTTSNKQKNITLGKEPQTPDADPEAQVTSSPQKSGQSTEEELKELNKAETQVSDGKTSGQDTTPTNEDRKTTVGREAQTPDADPETQVTSSGQKPGQYTENEYEHMEKKEQLNKAKTQVKSGGKTSGKNKDTVNAQRDENGQEELNKAKTQVKSGGQTSGRSKETVNGQRHENGQQELNKAKTQVKSGGKTSGRSKETVNAQRHENGQQELNKAKTQVKSCGKTSGRSKETVNAQRHENGQEELKKAKTQVKSGEQTSGRSKETVNAQRHENGQEGLGNNGVKNKTLDSTISLHSKEGSKGMKKDRTSTDHINDKPEQGGNDDNNKQIKAD